MIKSIKISYSILLLIGSLIYSIQSFGQIVNTAEKVDLLCDRSVYISGESISFSGLLSSISDSSYISEVVYVEIISPDGQRISKSKFKIIDASFSGQLAIPIDAISGYYYLRSYTKWMRNGSPEDYATIRIKLINPFNEDLLELKNGLIDTSKTSFKAIETLSAFENIPAHLKPGETFQIKLNNQNYSYKSSTLSIVPKGSSAFSEYQSINTIEDYREVSFIPETRGLTISGEVIDKNSKEKQPYFKVSIHIKDEKNFITALTDSLGRFYISLPEMYGNQELFIIAASEDEKIIEVLIDQDYCTKEAQYKVPVFSVSTQERDLILQMAQTLQLHDIYQSKDTLKNIPIEKTPFYGHPYKNIDFDFFIELDSMSQYFTDISSWVSVKKKKGKRKLYLSGEETELLYTDPLIMIDWVPVDDDENVLKMDARRVKGFDVIVKPYIHGSVIYGGMINVFTRNGDFGGFTFPKSAMYINYDFYSNKHTDKSILKNTSTWLIDLSAKNIEEGIDVVAPSISGSYEILLQTIDNDGKKLIYSKAFQVL